MSITSRPRSSRRGAGFGSARLEPQERVPQHTDTPPKPPCASLQTLRYSDVTGGLWPASLRFVSSERYSPRPPPPSRAPPRPRRSDAESGCSAVMSPRRARTTGSGLIPHFLPMVAAAFKPSNAIPSYLFISIKQIHVWYRG